jgi:hypothetical protein
MVGVHFEDHPRFRALLSDTSYHHVVLYPSDEARDIGELSNAKVRWCVWVVDGTWNQARKMWRRNPSLQQLPAYRISPETPGQYRIRREPAPHCLSTVEATAFLLGQLGEASAGELLRPFHSMIQRQLAYAAEGRPSRHVKRPPRAARRRPPPVELVANLGRLLLIHGEGNGWPAREQDTDRVEMLQWAASRPATGERFHALLQTRTRAPGILEHLQLNERDLLSSMSPDAFRATWRQFWAPTDILCTWGFFPLKLLDKMGFERCAYINLQVISNVHAGKRHGAIEMAYARFVGDTPCAPHFLGRGGRRLAMMEKVVGALT